MWAAKIKALCNCFSSSFVDVSKTNLLYIAALKKKSYDYEKLPDEKVFDRKKKRVLKQVNLKQTNNKKLTNKNFMYRK